MPPTGGWRGFRSTAWTDVEQFGYVHEGCLYVLNLASGETVLVDCAAPGAYYDIAYAHGGTAGCRRNLLLRHGVQRRRR